MSRVVIAAVLSLLAVSARADEPFIRVQQMCGFSFAPCGLPLTNLVQDADPIGYFPDAAGTLTFSLAYAGDSFVMQALRDNDVATSPSLPFGLIGWPASGPMMPPVGGSSNSTQLFFQSWMTFPTLAGQQLVVPLPAAPEPASAALLAVGLLLLAARKPLAATGHACARSIARWPTTTTYRWTSPTRARNSAARTGPR